MIRGSGSNWTAVVVDKIFSIFFAEGCRATQLFENPEGGINSLFASFALQAAQMFLSHFSAGGPHSGAQISWLNLAGEYRHQQRDQPPICLRKKVFGFRPKSIRGVRFADAWLHA